MYSDRLVGLEWILGVVSILWLLALTFWIWQINLLLKKLFPDSKKNFKDKLEEVLKEIESLENFKKNSWRFVQRIGLKRYNPYGDTGGDQSFSVSLLDGLGDGLVITSLHSRAGTRVFGKPVKSGKEGKFQFSKEEQEVIDQVLSQ